jgi:hypothetical protein
MLHWRWKDSLEYPRITKFGGAVERRGHHRKKA